MKRNILNFCLIILFVLTMCFQFLPKSVHEILGITFFICVTVHIYLNRGFFKNFHWSKMNNLKKFMLVLNALLIIDFFLVTLTGIFVSNHLFKEIFSQEVRRNILIHQLHISLPYFFLILSGLHFGLHWKNLWSRLTKNFNKNSLKYKIICFGSTLCLAIFGIYFSILNRIGDRIFFNHVFVTEATKSGLAIYILSLLSVFGLYAILEFWAEKLMIRRKNFTKKFSAILNFGGLLK